LSDQQQRQQLLKK